MRVNHLLELAHGTPKEHCAADRRDGSKSIAESKLLGSSSDLQDEKGREEREEPSQPESDEESIDTLFIRKCDTTLTFICLVLFIDKT